MFTLQLHDTNIAIQHDIDLIELNLIEIALTRAHVSPLIAEVWVHLLILVTPLVVTPGNLVITTDGDQ